jgi:hypothetical protein
MDHLLETAIRLAAKVHKGQTDRFGKPYILHVMRVMMRGHDLEEQILGALHDVLERSDLTVEDIGEEGFLTTRDQSPAAHHPRSAGDLRAVHRPGGAGQPGHPGEAPRPGRQDGPAPCGATGPVRPEALQQAARRLPPHEALVEEAKANMQVQSDLRRVR